MKQLPDDREKALDAIAAGWGRAATAAHPLCTCGQPVEHPQTVPACTICGAGEGEKCRTPHYSANPQTRYRKRIKAWRDEQACAVHGTSR